MDVVIEMVSLGWLSIVTHCFDNFMLPETVFRFGDFFKGGLTFLQVDTFNSKNQIISF